MMNITFFFAGCLIGTILTTSVIEKAKTNSRRYISLAAVFVAAISGAIFSNVYLQDFMLENRLPFTKFFLGLAAIEFVITILQIIKKPQENNQ